MLFMLILCIKWLRKSIIPSYDDNHVNPFSLAFAIGIFFKRPIHKSKSSTGAIKHMELCKKAQILVIHDFNDIQQLEIIFICHFTGFRPWSYWLCHDTRITALRSPFFFFFFVVEFLLYCRSLPVRQPGSSWGSDEYIAL